MQNQNRLKYVVVYFLTLALISCTSKNESFSDAIKKQRDGNIDKVPTIQSSMPYFSPHTLSPIWELSDNTKIVEIPEINLLDQNAKSVSKSDFIGKISIVGFVFTSCAGFCPLLINKLKQIKNEITQKNLQIVVVSVDPEFDSPKVLYDYAVTHKILNDEWRFITGEKKHIYSLIKNTFASEVRKIEHENMRKFAHTEHFYLLDKNARLRGVLNGTRNDLLNSAKDLVSRIE